MGCTGSRLWWRVVVANTAVLRCRVQAHTPWFSWCWDALIHTEHAQAWGRSPPVYGPPA